jgi:hypothetical protein
VILGGGHDAESREDFMFLHIVQQEASYGHEARIECHMRIVILKHAQNAFNRLLAFHIQIVIVKMVDLFDGTSHVCCPRRRR